MAKINDYIKIVGEDIIEELKILSERLKGKVIQNINSTSVGGGVAEILNRIVPLMNELGVDTRWDLIKGGERFFNITKRFHNTLHGIPAEISDEEFDYFLQVENENAQAINFYGDVILIHDPQPIGLINRKKDFGNNKKWIWRCHIDISHPEIKVWDFLKQFINSYDASIFSAPVFSKELPIKQFLISPSIDPLSDKNKELDASTIDSVLYKYKITKDKPIITQISRYDILKDPLGVIDAFKLVRKHIDCQLILAGNTATDDPEHDKVLNMVKEKAGNDSDIHILVIEPANNDIEINALQRASDIVLQKSLKEGFGLTVSEALWKKKPVIAGAVGGIPLQITHKHSGILTHTVEGTAYWIKQLINSPEYAKKLGLNGHEHIKNNFLLTRHILEYFLLFTSLYHSGDIIHLN
ncbi:MAG: glycosyl transferase family 1 [Elusimicrobia bacterium RIFOXYC2_FULL_34_12]|nr:MAG: glycosyl transferase family 1 [Elusimicrobia bacterium RIFOXYC2_FULL_34_12]OGS39177.1 MAG: glycosyl transferase family 1 [Elusimicrobia bacterium RIFOXYD2_FULL_34_30]HAM38047.1 glycosyl transferase family 1 [Elusimicrobiota bacterium]